MLLQAECRSATTDQTKHALFMNRTLTTALFILISRGSSMRYPACNRLLYLFTFTVKFRIHDSVHSLSNSWNFSRIGLITRDAYHSCKSNEDFTISRAHTFIGTFFTRYKFIKYCVYLILYQYVMFLNNTLHTFYLSQHYLSRIFEKLAKFDVSRIYYDSGQYDFRTLYQSPSKRYIRHPFAQTTFTVFQIFESYDSSNQRLFNTNR